MSVSSSRVQHSINKHSLHIPVRIVKKTGMQKGTVIIWKVNEDNTITLYPYH